MPSLSTVATEVSSLTHVSSAAVTSPAAYKDACCFSKEKFKSYLNNRTLCVMERDIRERGEDPWYKDTGRPYGDPKVDEPSWLAFLKEIQDEIRVRRERGEYS